MQGVTSFRNLPHSTLALILNKIEEETQKEGGKRDAIPSIPFLQFGPESIPCKSSHREGIIKENRSRSFSLKLYLLVAVFVTLASILKSFMVSRSNSNAERTNNNLMLSHLLFKQENKVAKMAWVCDFVKWKWEKEVDEEGEGNFGRERNAQGGLLPRLPLWGWREEPLPQFSTSSSLPSYLLL